MNDRANASDLFGSNVDDPDCNFQGKIQVGYYMGATMIKAWECELDLEEIMQMPGLEIKARVTDYLDKVIMDGNPNFPEKASGRP